jgi:hypothetical protein
MENTTTVEEDVTYNGKSHTYGFNPTKDTDQIKTYETISAVCRFEDLKTMLKVGATELYAHHHNMETINVLNLFSQYGVYDAIDSQFPNPKTHGIMDSYKFVEEFMKNIFEQEKESQ